MKKFSLFLVGIICLSVFSGCQKKNEISVITENDPIADYDSIEEVHIEGEKGTFKVSKKLYVSDDVNIPYFDLGRGGWVNKGKLAVIKVDNHVGRDCSIGITITYIKSGGSEIGQSEKLFLGFSNNDSNYFFFQPETDFDDITYEIRTLEDDTPGRSGYFTFSTVAVAEPFEMEDPALKELFGHTANLSSSMTCSSSETIYLSTETLYYDNEGKPICISSRSGENKGVLSSMTPDICVEQDGKYVLPDNMKGDLRCVVSIVKTMDQEQWAKMISGG